MYAEFWVWFSLMSLSPNRVNIHYSVEKKGASIEETFSGLVDELRLKRQHMPRTVVFCHSYEDVGYLYSFITSLLEEEAVEPIGAPDMARFHLADMFTASTERSIKDTIIFNFTRQDALLA